MRLHNGPVVFFLAAAVFLVSVLWGCPAFGKDAGVPDAGKIEVVDAGASDAGLSGPDLIKLTERREKLYLVLGRLSAELNDEGTKTEVLRVFFAEDYSDRRDAAVVLMRVRGVDMYLVCFYTDGEWRPIPTNFR